MTDLLLYLISYHTFHIWNVSPSDARWGFWDHRSRARSSSTRGEREPLLRWGCVSFFPSWIEIWENLGADYGIAMWSSECGREMLAQSFGHRGLQGRFRHVYVVLGTWYRFWPGFSLLKNRKNQPHKKQIELWLQTLGSAVYVWILFISLKPKQEPFPPKIGIITTL